MEEVPSISRTRIIKMLEYLSNIGTIQRLSYLYVG